ncbi:MAG: hypothetical protein GX330_04220 [Bacteroidales bacterium]|nr:hypothetical protein [Bacteroidales bacterium]
MASAIVRQAVDDWRRLIRLKRQTCNVTEINISFVEIRQFFNSEYCNVLLEIDPLIILEQLEKELREARENGALI